MPARSRGLVIAPTYTMIRDATLQTFLELITPADLIRDFSKSTMTMTLKNGTEILFRSGENPDRLRGPNIGWIWIDEAAYLDREVMNVALGRLRRRPGLMWLTTTPRGSNWLYDMFIRNPIKSSKVIYSSSRENIFLPPGFIETLYSAYPSHLIDQEIEGKFLLQVPGALWTYELLDHCRVPVGTYKSEDFKLIVIGVDPKASSQARSETGIVVAGLLPNGNLIVLEDASLDATPELWAAEVAQAYERWGANYVIAEVNQGGDMVKSVLRQAAPQLPIFSIHATRGKFTRAEPISVRYNQGLIQHQGRFPFLEEQMRTFIPGEKSPDRLDALVWALYALTKEPGKKEAGSYQGVTKSLKKKALTAKTQKVKL